MKMNTIIFFFLFALFSCEKDNNNPLNKEDISGNWVNIVNNVDTLFISDSIIKRTDTITMLPKHKYSYTLYEDSIKIIYTGEYYIYVLPSSFKISLDKNGSVLVIENLSTYFPKYKGDEFIKISTKN